MVLVIQRVSSASVTSNGEPGETIGPGFVVLVGAEENDDMRDVRFCVEKTAGLRVFNDGGGKMNLDLAAVGGSILAVSNFTLLGDCLKGRRPNFMRAARPEIAKPLFDAYAEGCRNAGIPTECGVFGADMRIDMRCDGPVTLMLNSRDKFGG